MCSCFPALRRRAPVGDGGRLSWRLGHADPRSRSGSHNPDRAWGLRLRPRFRLRSLVAPVTVLLCLGSPYYPRRCVTRSNSAALCRLRRAQVLPWLAPTMKSRFATRFTPVLGGTSLRSRIRSALPRLRDRRKEPRVRRCFARRPLFAWNHPDTLLRPQAEPPSAVRALGRVDGGPPRPARHTRGSVAPIRSWRGWAWRMRSRWPCSESLPFSGLVSVMG